MQPRSSAYEQDISALLAGIVDSQGLPTGAAVPLAGTTAGPERRHFDLELDPVVVIVKSPAGLDIFVYDAGVDELGYIALSF